jgi:hypothetical protein
MTPQRKVNYKGTILEKVFGECLHVEDMPVEETTPDMARMRQQCLLTGELVTRMVDCVRKDPRFPKRIGALGVLLWDLIGHRITPVALTVVPTISFVAEGTPGVVPNGTILIPWEWAKYVRKEPYMGFGGLICIGSQARDFYNKNFNFFDRRPVMQRAWAFEAEFLNSVKADDPEFVPNDYQKQVLDKYPEGLDSLPEGVWYESIPFKE